MNVRTLALAGLLACCSFVLPAAADAVSPSPSPPQEAAGAEADKARQWLLGSWELRMQPPPGEEDPGPITMAFGPDGVVKIKFPDQADEERGAWRVTGALPVSSTVLLDENDLDADAADDVYLEITYAGPDSGTGYLRSANGPESDRVNVAMTRVGANATKEPAKPQDKASEPAALPAPLALSETEPASVAGAIASIQKSGMTEGAKFGVAAVDLNGDGKDEALVKITQMTWCSGDMDTCRIFILQRDEKGEWQSLGYPYAKAVMVLDTMTGGWRDLSFDGKTFAMNGSQYGEKRTGP